MIHKYLCKTIWRQLIDTHLLLLNNPLKTSFASFDFQKRKQLTKKRSILCKLFQAIYEADEKSSYSVMQKNNIDSEK